MNVVVPISNPLTVPDGLGYYSDYAAYGCGFPAFDALQGGEIGTKSEASSPREPPGDFETQLFSSDFADFNGSCLEFEPEWLTQPISLLTPEEQAVDGIGAETSALFSPHSPPLAVSPQPFPGVLTPDSSLPSSPQSSSYYSSPSGAAEFEDVMSSLLEDDPTIISPVSCSTSTPLAPLSSPLTSFDGSSPAGSTSSIRDLLLQTAEDDILAPSSYQEPLVTRFEAGTPTRKRKVASEPRKPAKRRMSLAQKKERKKEQNKTAALRYRQRKREEKVGVDGQMAVLEAKNKKLKAEVESLETEVNYLKKLWAEVAQARSRKSMGQTLL